MQLDKYAPPPFAYELDTMLFEIVVSVMVKELLTANMPEPDNNTSFKTSETIHTQKTTATLNYRSFDSTNYNK